MLRRAAPLALALALLAAGPLRADPLLRLNGYVKNFSIMYRLPRPTDPGLVPSPGLLGQSIARLRLNLGFAPTPSLSVQVSYDLSPRIQDPLFFKSSPFAAALESGGYRVADLRTPLVPGPGDAAGSFGLYQNLDRLAATVRLKWGDLIIGRQPVAWGSGRVTNPTDVIAPFSFYDLDKEERFGVDAARLRLPLSALSELDLGYVFGRDFKFERSAFFLKGRTHALRTDLGMVVVGFQEDLLLGCDLARSLAGAGLWLEAACVWPGALGRDRPLPRRYGRVTAGIDRSLGRGLYGFIEYHFNAAGASDPADYAALFQAPAYRRGTVYLMGRHYLNVGATLQATPLIPLTGLVIWNLGDGSLALAPQAEYNVAENIYLGGGVYLGVGRAPRTAWFGAAGAAPDLRSEFGSYPDFVYVSFRCYF